LSVWTKLKFIPTERTLLSFLGQFVAEGRGLIGIAILSIITFGMKNTKKIECEVEYDAKSKAKPKAECNAQSEAYSTLDFGFQPSF